MKTKFGSAWGKKLTPPLRMVNEIMERIKRFKTEVSALKREKTSIRKEQNDEASADQMLDKAIAIEKEDVGIVQGMIQDTDKVIVQGRDVARELNAQGEKLRGVDRRFDDIEDGVKQSRNLLTAFRRTLMRDKCIRALMVVILVGVLLLVIWAIIDPYIHINGSNSTSSSTPAESPKFK